MITGPHCYFDVSDIEIGATYQHYTGRLYEVLAVANVANWNPKYEPVVVYRSLRNKNWWTKPLEDFRKKMTKFERTQVDEH